MTDRVATIAVTATDATIQRTTAVSIAHIALEPAMRCGKTTPTGKRMTPEVDVVEVANKAVKFAEEHIVEMCREMVAWRSTSILRDGRVRELARMLEPLGGDHYALSIAESYVTNAAFKFVANQGKTTE